MFLEFSTMDSSLLNDQNSSQERTVYQRIEKEKEHYHEKLKILKKIQSILQLQKNHLEKSNMELETKSTDVAIPLSPAAKEVYNFLNKIWEFKMKILKCKYSIQYNRCEKEKINSTASLYSIQTYCYEQNKKAPFDGLTPTDADSREKKQF